MDDGHIPIFFFYNLNLLWFSIKINMITKMYRAVYKQLRYLINHVLSPIGGPTNDEF